jgi:hypothetical protein
MDRENLPKFGDPLNGRSNRKENNPRGKMLPGQSSNTIENRKLQQLIQPGF